VFYTIKQHGENYSEYNQEHKEVKIGNILGPGRFSEEKDVNFNTPYKDGGI
jgi:hypothetical protein